MLQGAQQGALALNSSSTVTNNNDHGATVSTGPIIVNTQAKDGPGVVAAIRDAINRNLLVGQANTGLGVNILQLPLADAVRLNAEAAAGDTEAKAFFAELFPTDAVCFLCDAPAGLTPLVAMFVDPDDRNIVNAVPYCPACATMLPTKRMARELKMLRSMWPHGRWKLRNDPNARGRKA